MPDTAKNGSLKDRRSFSREVMPERGQRPLSEAVRFGSHKRMRPGSELINGTKEKNDIKRCVHDKTG